MFLSENAHDRKNFKNSTWNFPIESNEIILSDIVVVLAKYVKKHQKKIPSYDVMRSQGCLFP